MSELVLSSAARRLQTHPAKDRILDKYREGETPQAIAEWLQHDLMEFPESSVDDLARSIRELFVTEVPIEERLALSTEDRSAMRKTLAKQKNNKSTYHIMRELLQLQMGRIELYHEYEMTRRDRIGNDTDKSGMSGSLTHEMETARRMLRDMHEMEQELGVRPGESSDAPQGGMTPAMRMKLGKALKGLIDESDEQEDPIDVEVVTHEDPESN